MYLLLYSYEGYRIFMGAQIMGMGINDRLISTNRARLRRDDGLVLLSLIS
jgi:hypothetical protein